MKKAEIVKIIQSIVTYYPNYKMDDPEKRLEELDFFLHDADYEQVMKNLVAHIKTDKFAPTIADLLKIDRISGRAVPNVVETKLLLQINEMSDKLLSNEDTTDVEVAKAEARRLLGIEGDN